MARAVQARRLAETAIQAAASAERHARDALAWADSAAVGADKMMSLATEMRSMAEAATLLGKSAQESAGMLEVAGDGWAMW